MPTARLSVANRKTPALEIQTALITIGWVFYLTSSEATSLLHSSWKGDAVGGTKATSLSPLLRLLCCDLPRNSSYLAEIWPGFMLAFHFDIPRWPCSRQIKRSRGPLIPVDPISTHLRCSRSLIWWQSLWRRSSCDKILSIEICIIFRLSQELSEVWVYKCLFQHCIFKYQDMPKP